MAEPSFNSADSWLQGLAEEMQTAITADLCSQSYGTHRTAIFGSIWVFQARSKRYKRN